MRATTRLLAKSLTGRSLDEARRWAQLALTGDAIRGRYDPLPLLDFSEPDSVTDCQLTSDASYGGKSSALLRHIPKTATEPAHARFYGSISTALPEKDPSVVSTGYAGFRNKDRAWTVFGTPLWDLGPYPWLALRVKSDGRKYFVNLQTETVVPTDIHQHRLHTRTPGEWETVFLDYRSFCRTNHGHVVEPQNEILKHKTRTVGFSSIDRKEGPFDLRIQKVWAAVELDEGNMLQNDAR